MQFEAILMFLLLVVYMICAGIKALFRLVTGEAQREREEEQRQENERRRREKEREQEEAAKRQAKADAKKQFEQSVMQGQFPSGEVLSAFSDFESECEDIPTNVKEAFEELLYGSCTLRSISYGEAVRLIRQHGRIGERARQRAGRVGSPGDDPDRPLGESEALALLGVARRCSGMHGGRTGACVPPEDVAVAPGQVGNDGTGIKGLRHSADATNQRGVPKGQVHDGAELWQIAKGGNRCPANK
jgi:hypothetical protein